VQAAEDLAEHVMREFRPHRDFHGGACMEIDLGPVREVIYIRSI
jgi:hypothetical protein